MTTASSRPWIIAPPPEPDPALLALVSHQQIAVAALIRRGYADPEQASRFLDPGVYTPALPIDLPDIDRAVELLESAIRNGQPILIWGDFDADGQTATALLLDALQSVSLLVTIHIPDRLREGHGITVERLAARIDEIFAESHGVPLLITCDTGITAHEAIDYARLRGLTTIITDHHEMPVELPEADAVINPHRLPPDHPMASLPGVGVAFQLIRALVDRGVLKESDPYLDLVALGIVADVAELTHDTRYWLQRGLNRLRHTDRPGLRALFDAARLEIERAGAEQIGFQIGPRLNAAGRIGDPLHAVELLVTRDSLRALVLADELEGLNRHRRQMQRQIETEVKAILAADPPLAESPVLVLYRPNWAAGILGPAIGGLVEKYGRPVILLTAQDAPDGQARGSARSANGFDLNAALASAADLLTSYGGHAEAAGLIVPIGNIPALRRALNHRYDSEDKHAGESHPDPLIIDYVAPFNSLTLPTMSALAALAPFGEGNPPITLMAEGVQISNTSYIDRAHVHRRLVIEDQTGSRYPAFWWNSGELAVPEGLIDIVYTLTPDPDASRGIESGYGFRIELTDWRSHDGPAAVAPPARQVSDIRHTIDNSIDLIGAVSRLSAKLDLPDPAQLQIWAEGFAQRESPGVGRSQLQPKQPLLIVTAPPDLVTLRAVIQTLEPPQVYLLATDPPPPFDSADSVTFARELHGVIRYVMHYQEGRIDRQMLCSRVAQSEAVVRYALTGLPRLDFSEDGDSWVFSLANRSQAGNDWMQRLSAMLEESRAYRDYLQNAPIEALIAQIG